MRLILLILLHFVRKDIPLKEGLRLYLLLSATTQNLPVRKDIPLKEGLRLFCFCNRSHFLNVRKDIPLKEGLRQFDCIFNAFHLSESPKGYSTKRRIKTKFKVCLISK